MSEQDDLRIVHPARSHIKTPQCEPDERVWFDVAVGQVPGARQQELLIHATHCDYCGGLLRQAFQDFHDEPTPGELEQIAAMGPVRIPQPVRQPGWWSKLPAAVRTWGAIPATALLTLVAAQLVEYMRRPTPEILFQRAYASWRTIEFRLAGVPYAKPARVELAERDSSVDRPPAVADAIAQSGRELQKNPRDPAWLQARARLHLLANEPDHAIPLLETIVSQEPKGSALLLTATLDLAAAYYETGRQLAQARYAARAYEKLSELLRDHPGQREALFNRIIAADALQMPRQALDDCEAFLKAEPGGEWADEARLRCDGLRKKIQSPSQPDPDPRRFLQGFEKGNSGPAELYVDVATIYWLQMLPASQDALAALKLLALLLQQQHGDGWLADLLKAPVTAQFQSGAAHLALSARATEAGDRDKGVEYARLAVSSFVSDRNPAGILRARWQLVYALSRGLAGDLCLREAEAISEELVRRRYGWIAIQNHLEEITAHARGLRYGKANAAADQAKELVVQHKYAGLGLRLDAFVSFNNRYHGKMIPAWNSQVSGLKQFWSGDYLPMRGYQFLADLSMTAESESMPWLALTYARESQPLLSMTNVRMTRALAEFRTGNLLAALGQGAEARRALDSAEALFSELPVTPASRRNRLEVELLLAEIDIREGKPVQALARLRSVEQEAGSTDFKRAFVRYLRLRGMAQEASGNSAEAMESLGACVHEAERVFGSLEKPSDRAAWQNEAGSAYRKLVELQLNRGDTRQAFDTFEWYRGSVIRKAGITKAVEPAPAPTGQDTTAFLSFVELGERVGAWLLDRDGLSFRWVDARADALRTMAANMAVLCADPRSDVELHSSFDRISRWLYNQLIEPFESRLGATRVLVVESDDSLAALPFEALRNAQGEYLAASQTVLYTPGLWVWQSLSGRTKSVDNSSHLVALLNPAPGQRARSTVTPTSQERVAALLGQFPNRTEIRAAEVTSASLSGALPGADLFFFLGHGLSHGGGGALVMSSQAGIDEPARLVEARDIETLRLDRTSLVLLAACSAGKGETSGLANPHSLVRAFLYAGSPAVVAARWRLDLDTAVTLAAGISQNTVAGRSPASALRNAALAMRKSHPHPYHWAALSFFGADPIGS